MKLLNRIPELAARILAGARRPGDMLSGRILVHPVLRAALETALAADVTLMTDGSFRVDPWFGEGFLPGVPAAPRDREAAQQRSNGYAQYHGWRRAVGR